MTYLEQFPPVECACLSCQAMCMKKPCWPTPREVVRLIRAGYGNRLMLDWWEEDDDLPHTEIVAPAALGSEGRMAGAMMPCNFFIGGRCQIHSLKPIEGRLAVHNPVKYDWYRLHLEVAKTWNTASGRRVVNYWAKRFCR